MKKLYTIFLGIATLATLSACQGLNEMPVFEETESFASFPTKSFSLDENGGKVVIPVEVASLKPIQTVVSYKINDGTAKAGVDFKDTNASAVLTFDGETRSQDIVIDILPRMGEYTGDLSFTIELLSATGIKLSMENNCKVTILDLDHPLAPILGAYNASAVSSYDGSVSWTMTLLKDPTDVTVVWMQGLTNEVMGDDQLFYANVVYDDDENIVGIAFPAGQYVPGGSYDFWLVGNRAGSGSYYPDAVLLWEFNNGTFTFANEEPNSIGILACDKESHEALGWWNRYDVPPSYVKQ